MLPSDRHIIDLVYKHAKLYHNSIITGGAATWGAIIGSLSNQTDLYNTLGAKIDKTIGTTKGDLISFTGSANPARLPVGTDGYILKASSLAGSGLVWGTLDASEVLSLSETIDDRIAALMIGGNVTAWTYVDASNTLKVDVSVGAGLGISGSQIIHGDTSTQASIDLSTSNVLQDLTLDTYGHITGYGSVDVRTLFSTSYPLTYTSGTGVFGFNYNSINLKLTSNALNTIQDIAVTSSPTFNLPNFTGGLKINGVTLSDALRNLTTGNITATGTANTDLPAYSAEFLIETGWTSTGWNGDFTTWTHTTGNTNVLSQSKPAVIGTKYQIAYIVTSRTAGSFNLGFGGQNIGGVTTTGAFGPTAISTANLTITPTTDFDGTIIISIKSIIGISASLISLKSSDGSVRIEIRANSGNANTFLGLNAGRYNTTGLWNTANGVQALFSNTTGLWNTANGVQALAFNTTGFYNTANGVYALYNNTTGNYNTANGVYALYNNTTGNYNTANGMYALYNNTTGNYNTANGVNAGRYISDGGANATSNNSVYIGYNTMAMTNGDTNEIVIGTNAIGNGSNSVTLGNTSITKTILNGNVGIGIITPTEKLEINGNLKALTAKLTNLTDGYFPYHISDASGLGNSNIFTDGINVGIGTTTLSGTDKLTVNGNTKQFGDIYSDNFNNVDPYLGYYIGREGSIFSKITANELHVKFFIADLEQALAGSQVISKSVAKVFTNVTLPATFGSTFQLTVESFDGFPNMQVFAINDIVRLRSGHDRTNNSLTITDSWGKITAFLAYDDNGRRQIWLVELVAGAVSAVIKEGTIVNDYGQSGNGIVESVAINPLGNSPYHQIATWTTAPYSDMKIQDRRGDLTGVPTTNFGTLTGFGGYSQKFYAENNVYIAGNIWALTGGIGGTYSSPVVTLANYGMKINTAGTATSLTADSIMIGNISGSANSAIKLTKTSLPNESGFFGYASNAAEMFALRLDGTAQIAGWNFDSTKLYKASGYYNLSLNAGSDYPFIYAGYGQTIGDYDTAVIVGRIPTVVGANAGEIGIIAYSDALTRNDYFILTDLTRSIASWNFDSTKFYNSTDIVLDAFNKRISVANNAVQMYYTSSTDYGIKDSAGKFQLGYVNKISGWTFDDTKLSNSSTRLEASTLLKGLGVSDGVNDIVKVGDFTNATETYFTSAMPNAPIVVDPWTIEINVASRLAWNSYGANYGMSGSSTDFVQYQWRTYVTLPINDVKGKTISVSFGIAEQESANGTNKATYIWGYIQTDVGKIALTDITPTNNVYLIGTTPVYESRTITASIPSNATYARFYLSWNKNSIFSPADVLFNNWSFLVYSKTIIELNKTGFKLYNSPLSRIKLTNSEAVFDVPTIKASTGIQIGSNWVLTTEPYLEGDGITLNERLTLKFKGVSKGFFSETDGTYYHV